LMQLFPVAQVGSQEYVHFAVPSVPHFVVPTLW